MIDAVLEAVPVDKERVLALITQASNHRKSAAGAVDNESAYILLYSAVHKALTAVLLAEGFRVTAGERAHAVLIREAKARLGREHAELLTRIDRARRKRNNVAYETEEVTKAELDAMVTNVNETLKAVSTFIKERVG